MEQWNSDEVFAGGIRLLPKLILLISEIKAQLTVGDLCLLTMHCCRKWKDVKRKQPTANRGRVSNHHVLALAKALLKIYFRAM